MLAEGVYISGGVLLLILLVIIAFRLLR